MISQRLRGYYTLFIVYQLALTQAVFWLHFLFISNFYSRVPDTLSYFIYSLIVFIALSIEAASRKDIESNLTDKSILEKSKTSLRQVIFAAGGIVFFLVATKDQVISRTFLFSYLLVLYGCLYFSAQKLPDSIVKRFSRRWRLEKTLLVGSAKRAQHFSEWLARKSLLRFEVIGVLDNETGAPTSNLPILGTTDQFEQVIREKKINQVILVELPTDSDLLAKLIADCERLGVRLLAVSDLEEKFRRKIVYMENDGMQIIGLREEPLENPFNRALKRGLDLLVAIPVVFLILPFVIFIVWLLQRFQSPGPVFFVQERAGFHNNPFRIVKFRTMNLHNDREAKQATATDQRIYPAGRWLRKYSLDELPQFLNVLLGQMSVVGPRPHLKEHNEQFSKVMDNYHVRSFVKPGITGLAQVRGFRGEATNEAVLMNRISSDISYLENWSFSGDVLIITRTFWHVISPPKTAY